jgi:lipopolysaccharide export system permease protein
VSWGRDGIRRVIVEGVEEIIYGRLRQQRSYSTSQVSINVKAVQGRRLIRPTLSFAGGPGGAPATVSAAEAELSADASAGTLVVTLRDGTLHMGDVKASFPDTLMREVPLDAVSRKGKTSTSPSEIALADFPEALRAQTRLIDRYEQVAAGRWAQSLLAGRMEGAVPAAVKPIRDTLRHERSRLDRIVMEPWRRWANGFSCLCFVLVGAPMAIRMRNADFLTSFFMCFLPILVIYYPVFMLGVDQAKRGAVPPVAVWTGNVLIACWGWWLLRQVVRT